MNEKRIEKIARVLCAENGQDPDALEPGNLCWQPWMDQTKAMNADYDHLFDDQTIPPDGYNLQGDPCCFLWRDYIWQAQAVLHIIQQED